MRSETTADHAATVTASAFRASGSQSRPAAANPAAANPTAADRSLPPLLALWRKTARYPGGRRLFSWMVGRKAPYTGTLGARVEELAPGLARLSMRDRRRLSNHLRSIHAAALMNLAEETSGLAMMSTLPADVRGIVTGFEMSYLKKARGTLTATSRFDLPEIAGPTPVEIEAEIENGAGELVARGTATWLLDLKA